MRTSQLTPAIFALFGVALLTALVRAFASGDPILIAALLGILATFVVGTLGIARRTRGRFAQQTIDRANRELASREARQSKLIDAMLAIFDAGEAGEEQAVTDAVQRCFDASAGMLPANAAALDSVQHAGDGERERLSVPLRVAEQDFGVLWVERSERFDNEARQAFATLAASASLALSQSRLRRAIDRRRQEAQFVGEAASLFSRSLNPKEIADAVAVQGARWLVDTALVFEADTETPTIHLAAVSGRDAEFAEQLRAAFAGRSPDAALGASGQAIQTRQPVLVRDYAQYTNAVQSAVPGRTFRSYLALPLVLRDRVWGVLALTTASGSRELDDDDLRVGVAVADVAAAALENALLHERAERRGRDARFLAEASRLLDDPIAPESLADRVAQHSRDVIADTCLVLLMDENGLQPAAAADRDPDREAVFRERMRTMDPESPTLLGRVFQNRQAYLAPDYASDPESAGANNVPDTIIGTRSLLAAPILGTTGVIGVIVLATHTTGRLLDADDLNTAEALASRIGPAIERAQALAREHALNEDLAAQAGELQRARDESERGRGFLATILASIPDAVLVIDAGGRLVEANAVARQFLDLPDEAKLLRDSPAGPLLTPILTDLAGEPSVVVRDVPIRGGIGQARGARLTGLGEDTVVIIRDVSRERELERLQTDFLSNVSHELRTPLTSILGFADLLLDDTDLLLDADQHDSLQTIHRQGSHLLSLINDLLDLARLESGREQINVAPLTLQPAVDRVVADLLPVARSKSVEIRTQLPADPIEVQGNHRALHQILTNLLGNAVKFTPTGGNVRIRTQVDGTRIGIQIRDSGEGIPAEAIPHLFSKFYQVEHGATRRHGGTGLGLAISQRLVQLLGGEIAVESTVGRGSTFTIWLAAAGEPAAAEAVTPTQPIELPPSLPAPILIVDDQPDILRLTRTILGARYRVVTATNGAEALIKIAEEWPALVLLDLAMPVLDGVETCRRIRLLPDGSTLPILALTAQAMPKQQDDALAAGFDAVITKPFSPADLVGTVAQWLASPTRTRKILIVEDDPRIQAILIGQVRRLGFEVSVASSGEEAINAAIADRPDAITLDLLLPDMHGTAVLQQLKDDPRTATIPVVAISAHDDAGTMRALGAIDVLPKPIDATALRRALAGAIRPSSRTPRILVVDDDPSIADLIAATLRPLAADIQRASSGPEALQLARSGQPDLIVLDLLLPGLSGFDVAEALQREGIRAPVLALSVLDLAPAEAARLAGSGASFMPKTAFQPEAFLTAVVRALAAHESSQVS